MNQTESPRYATLLYDVRKKLGVSISEYFYLDMIHKLSYGRWCTKTLENCAADMGIGKRGLLKMRDRLIIQGYLCKNEKGHLKVTDRYIEVAVNKVHPVDNFMQNPVNLVPNLVNKVHRAGELSSPKNNNRITIEINNKNKAVENSGRASRETVNNIRTRLTQRGVLKPTNGYSAL